MSGQEYNAVLLSLLGVAAIVGAILFWRMFTRMEVKIDSWFAQHLECRERQQKEFVTHQSFADWKASRGPLWKRINTHSHEFHDGVVGKVIISED